MSLSDRIANKRKELSLGAVKNSVPSNVTQTPRTNLLQDRIEKKRLSLDVQKVSQDVVSLGSEIKTARENLTDKNTMYALKNKSDALYKNLDRLYNKSIKTGADSSVASYLSQAKRAFGNGMNDWDDLTALYDSYKSQDAFDASMKKYSLTEKYKGKSYDEVQKILSLGAKSMPKEEREFLFHYGTNVGWNTLEDYDKNIAAWTKTGKNGQKMERAGIEGLRQARNIFDIDHRADKWVSEAKKDPSFASKTTSLGTSSEEINPGYGKTDAVDLLKFAEFATDDERDAYTYYKSTDPKKAKEMLDDMKITIDKRYTENMEKNVADYSEAWGGWSVIPNAIGAVATVPFRGMGFVEDVVNTIKGEEINPYSMAHSASNFSEALTRANTKTLDTGSGISVFGQDIGSFAYNALQSTAESIVGANLFGSMYTPIMGMSAASSKAREMKEQGYGDTDIAVSSFISGAIEAACEYLPTERYLTLQKADMYGIKRTLKGILGQAAEEGLEEGVTEILNKTYDAFAHADTNEMSKMYKEYISLGYTEEEARTEVAKSIANDVLGAMAGGALSGGIMGGQAKFTSSKAVKSEGSEINKVGSVETLMKSADNTLGQITEENLKDEAFKPLSKYVDLYNRAKSGETLSDADTGHLLEGIKEAAEALGTDEARNAANDAYNFARDPGRKAAEEAYKEAEKTRREELGEKMFVDTYKGVGKASDEYLRAKYNDDIAEGFESVLENHKGKIDSESLMRAYTTAIEYGENGLFDEYDAIQATNNILTESESKKAFLEGYKHGQAKLQKVTEEVNTKIEKANLETTKYTQGTFKTDGIKNESLTKHQKKNIQILKGLSKLGINVELFASEVGEDGKRKGENGSFDKNTNTIRIDIYSNLTDNTEALDNAITSTVSHELTHWAEGKANDIYKALSKSVFAILKESDGIEFEKRIDNEIKANKAEHGRNLSIRDAESEIVARACEDCLVNSEKMYQMLMNLGDDSLKRRFSEALHKTAKKIKDLFGEIKAMLSQGETATAIRDSGKLEDITKMWEDMLEKAIKANQADLQAKTEGKAEADTETETENVADNIVESYEDEQSETDETLKQDRDTSVSPRKILLNAEVNTENITESRLLSEYKLDAGIVENAMTRLDEIREALKTEKDSTKISALHVEQRTLERRVINYNRQLDKLEGTATLMKVYDRETVKNIRKRSVLAQEAAWQRAQEKAFELIAKRNDDLYKQKYEMLLRNERKLREENYKRLFDNAESRKKLEETKLKSAKKLSDTKYTYEQRIAEIKQENAHRNAERRESAEKKKYFNSILDTAKKLGIMLKVNSAEKHVPKAMRTAVADLIDALDFTSSRGLGDTTLPQNGVPYKKDIKISNAMQNFVNAVSRASEKAKGVYENDEASKVNAVEEDFSNLFMLIPDGMKEDLDEIIEKIRRFENMESDGRLVLNRLTAAETKYVAQTMKAVYTLINDANKLHANAVFESVRELGASDLIELSKKKIGERKPDGEISKFLAWKNLQPINAFSRISTGAKSIFGELQRGFNTFAFRANEAVEFAKETFTGKEAKKWKKDTIDVYDYNGDPFKMSIAQAMSLYCLAKREQAQGHIYGYGVRVSPFGEGKNAVADNDTHNMNESGIIKLMEDLEKYNPRTLQVADTLQNFMSTTCSEWGNEVSMTRFGYEAFEEKNYFPIRVNDEHGMVKDSDETSLFRLLNSSFAKPLTQHANNSIYIDNIFEVFSQHSTDMAKYNALAMSVLDTFKWLNYIEKDVSEDGAKKAVSIRQAINAVYGDEASKYVLNLIRDINGAGQSVRDEGGLKKLMSNVKRASVGFNISVAMLQPTSYFRAKAVLPAKYLALGLKTPHPFKAFERATKYSGMAKYKALGFYDINASQSITSMITRDETKLDALGEASMKLAEKGDEFTWGYLWTACEAKVNNEYKSLRHGSPEYYAKVAETFDEIIYKTQVIDTVLTRSQVMRDKSVGWQAYTAFMSEPTVSYNIFASQILNFNDTKKLNGVKFAAKKCAKPIANAFVAHCITAAASTLVRSFVNGLRNYDPDEDEDGSKLEELWKTYISEFTIEIPILKEVVEMWQGYTPRNLMLQGFQDAINFVNDIEKIIEGKDVKLSKIFNDFAKAASELTGVPGYGLLRDAKALWNSTYAKYIDKDAYIE